MTASRPFMGVSTKQARSKTLPVLDLQYAVHLQEVSIRGKYRKAKQDKLNKGMWYVNLKTEKKKKSDARLEELDSGSLQIRSSLPAEKPTADEICNGNRERVGHRLHKYSQFSKKLVAIYCRTSRSLPAAAYAFVCSTKNTTLSRVSGSNVNLLPAKLLGLVPPKTQVSQNPNIPFPGHSNNTHPAHLESSPLKSWHSKFSKKYRRPESGDLHYLNSGKGLNNLQCNTAECCNVSFSGGTILFPNVPRV
ncbi:uncharacterized protein LOC135308618 isoform X2 [Passer domesticus]|uniref:uncharacterized protein LOC135308618 isoform X2 n=1 Tax=Passer domesticus TaxID=48849 RepID=UPI0030FF0851